MVSSMICLLISALFLLAPSPADAATIQYIGTGKKVREIEVIFSRNHGATWQKKSIKAGQSLAIPPDATQLIIDGVPRDPKKTYKVKDGIVF